MNKDSRKKFLAYIRHLEIFGEEKQLRQVPESAKHLDAVRFLTVHASKGLEFKAIYLPGLGQGKFPSKRQARRCPPPTNMIPTLDGNEHEEEEECLFFVALSRARDVLCGIISQALPRPSDGAVTWPDTSKDDSASPAVTQSPDVRFEFDVEALEVYLRCPHQYFYEHVVNINGKGDDSAYLLFHRTLYAMMSWIVAEQSSKGSLTETDVLAQLDNIWAQQGPVGYPFEDVYKEHAKAIIIHAHRSQLLANSTANREAFKVELPSGDVKFNADQIIKLDDGTEMLRRTRTGRISKGEKEKNIYALYQSVASAKAEILSLSSGVTEPVLLSPKVMKTRLDRYNEAIRGITEKRFAPQPSDHTCPRCSFYFVCTSND